MMWNNLVYIKYLQPKVIQKRQYNEVIVNTCKKIYLMTVPDRNTRKIPGVVWTQPVCTCLE